MTHLVALLHSPQVLKDLCDLVEDNDTLVTSAFDALIEHGKVTQYAPPLWVDLSPCLTASKDDVQFGRKVRVVGARVVFRRRW